MKLFLVFCIIVVLVGVFLAFLLCVNKDKGYGEVVMRVALLPTSISDYSLYHEVWYCEIKEQATLVSYFGTRRGVETAEGRVDYFKMPGNNPEDAEDFFEEINRRRKVKLSEEDYQHLVYLVEMFKEDDYVYEELNFLGMRAWLFILSYGDTTYRMERWAENAEQFQDIIDEIIRLSPIPMPERFWS